MKIHVVKEGDTLYKLSQKYGVDLEKLKEANPQLQDPDQIDIGMKIKIPGQPKQLSSKKWLLKKKEEAKPEAKEKQKTEKIETDVKKEIVKPEQKKEEIKPEAKKEEAKPQKKEEVKAEAKEKETGEVKPKADAESAEKEEKKKPVEVKIEVKKEVVKKMEQPEAKEVKDDQKAKDLFKPIPVPSLEVGSFYDLPKIPEIDEDAAKVQAAKTEVKMNQPIQAKQPAAGLNQGKPSVSEAYGQSYPAAAAQQPMGGKPGANAAMPYVGYSAMGPPMPIHAPLYMPASAAGPNAAFANMPAYSYGVHAAYPNAMFPTAVYPNAVHSNMAANMAYPAAVYPSAAHPNAMHPNVVHPAYAYANAAYPYAPVPGMHAARQANPCGCQQQMLPLPYSLNREINAADETAQSEPTISSAGTAEDRSDPSERGDEPAKAAIKKTAAKKKEAKPAAKIKSVPKKKGAEEKTQSDAKSVSNPWLNT